MEIEFLTIKVDIGEQMQFYILNTDEIRNAKII